MVYVNHIDSDLRTRLIEDLTLGKNASRRIGSKIDDIIGRRHSEPQIPTYSKRDQKILKKIIDPETNLPNSAGLDTLLLTRMEQVNGGQLTVPMYFIELEIRGGAYSMREMADYTKNALKQHERKIPWRCSWKNSTKCIWSGNAQYSL